MAKTITEIQALLDEKVDSRQIINEIADYLQANPGGGSGGTGAFADFTGAPEDNPALAEDFAAKSDKMVMTELEGDEWNIGTQPHAYKTIEENTVITLTGGTNAQTMAFLLITSVGTNTLTVDGRELEIQDDGDTSITVIKKADGTYTIAVQLFEPAAPVEPTVYVSDDFNRAAGALGNAVVGGAWSQKQGQVNTSGTAAIASAAGDHHAVINTTVTDNFDIDFDIPTITAVSDKLYIFFCVDSTVATGFSFRPNEGIVGGPTSGTGFSGGVGNIPVFAAGTHAKITIRNTELKIYKDAVLQGTWVVPARAGTHTYFSMYFGDTSSSIDNLVIQSAA